ncbi:F0F1 ATP synthase subunit alpha [Breoghania sp.]|uniref:F0F1 ATP synthase subunit alpha n=1 Tax=Breoghania sp. TaxID=2065378 RepID=UPI002AA89469|nr:F0F1 ATP synthase subunit alpha [Breoghania sp.]
MSEQQPLADWLDRSRTRLRRANLGPDAQAIGRVVHLADGIARISGLPDAPLGALVRFENGHSGFVQALDRDTLDAVMLDDAGAVSAGSRVVDTGEVLRVPVGEELLGRVVDPLGRPLDQGAELEDLERHPVERPAPSIIARDKVSHPVETGVLVVDSLFALGRGQRELILGDRATGKTALAVDAIINQKTSDVVCVYVAVGQRTTAVERVIAAVREYGAPERCIFVVGNAAAAPGLQWLAPFSGMTMAEYFRDRGQHALIVIDDLTRHAATHRELSLLTREPPGREAYPGDIFYLHARLLERAAKLAETEGGGSLTALPIAETDAGNLSAYIPTNLISITDGQIALSTRLFAAGQRPAVDVGLSVSRVGGKAQSPALRKVSGRIRLEYAQFQELEMFTRFGGITNPRVQSQIARGERIRSLLTQPRFANLRGVDQVALLSALGEGTFDTIPVSGLGPLRKALPGWLNAHAPEIVAKLGKDGTLDEDQQARLSALVADLARTILPQGTTGSEGASP